MKTNRFLLTVLFSLFCLWGLYAQTFPKTIQWKEVQTLTTETFQVQVLDFEGATAASANDLPYYLTKMDVSDDFQLEDYNVSIVNIALMPLSAAEEQVIARSGNYVPASVSPEIELVRDGYKKQLKIKFLPILGRDNSYRKVQSFEIDLQKKSVASAASRPQRAAAAIVLYPEVLPSVKTGMQGYSSQIWVNDASMGADFQYTVSAGQLPDGLQLKQDTYGVYIQHIYDTTIQAYLPIVSNGKFTITATSKDGSTSISREYDIQTGCENIYLQIPTVSISATCGVYEGGTFLFKTGSGEPVTPSEPVTFSLTGNVPETLTISAEGFLQGSVSLPQTPVKVLATTKSGCRYEAQMTIINNMVRLNNTSLKLANTDSSYEVWMTATGGSAPYSYSATGLPAGLTISSTGKISGTTSDSGQYNVAVTVTDAAGCAQTVTYPLTVSDGSVLASGNWYKIRIPETGNYKGSYSGNNFSINYVPEQRIYKLTYEQLRAMEGINPDEDVHVFGYGGAMLSESAELTVDDLPELPLYMEKGADGVFNAGDYILFYTQGPLSWEYKNNEYFHTRNPYSNYGYYFVASGLGTPTMTATQVEEVNAGQRPDRTITTYPVRILHENETLNLSFSGRNWYGEKFVMPANDDKSSKFYTVVIPDIVPSSNVYLRADAVAWNNGVVDANNNVMRIYYEVPNPVDPVRVGWNRLASDSYAARFNVASSESSVKATALQTPLYGSFNIQNNPSFRVDLRYLTRNKDPKVAAWLDYLTITAQSKLVMHGDQLTFDAASAGPTSNNSQFSITDITNPATIVWDITNPNQALEMPTQMVNAKLGFIAKMDKTRSFVAFNPKGNFPTPESVGKVANQNLQAEKNVDYVIISPQDFLAEAERLANAHREKSNLIVEVVTPEQVFNEFSSGTPDATAFRRLMKHVYNSSPIDRPNYLLLFGDGTFDNRAQTNNPALHNYVMTFQAKNSINTIHSYLTDDYFGLINGTAQIGEPGSGIDIGIGRLPVNNTTQASNVVDKIIAYMNNTEKGAWKKRMVQMGDDWTPPKESSTLHITGAEKIAKLISEQHPKFQIDKIYLDAYKQSSGGGESYPQARTKLLNTIEEGTMLFNYVGHGAIDRLSNEVVIGTKDIQAMTNKNQGFWVTATCDFAIFDNPAVVNGASAAEYAVLQPGGAAIGLMTTTRTVFSAQNDIINFSFMKNVFANDAQGNRLRVGDSYRLTKREMYATSSALSNSLSYALLGDPALMLTYPEYDVVTDAFSINGQPAEAGNVTLKGLDVVEIKGHIANDGSRMDDFNGELQLDLFDKIVTKQTLRNHGESTSFKYEDRDKILSASAKVENGEFTVLFMLPGSISPTEGGGRISYYASSDDAEAFGINEDISVGGMGEARSDDEEGPAMKIYLNDPTFVSGSTVNESPTFYAELSDPSGLNYSGSSSIFCIGCDMTITLDNETDYIVNEYFTPDMGSYTSGIVNYLFESLPAGKHHLKFTARDMLGTSNSATLEFEVKEGFSVFRVKAYPNPAKSFTNFAIEYTQPGEPAKFDIKVYDLTGRLVYSETQTAVANSGFDSLTEAEWKLNSSNGQKLSAGVYLYNAEVTTKDGKTSRSNTERIIIQ
jgi:hypothetical protein